ncbi:hypothetical protein Enr13x_34170 [Stieleria neptunia]|uniref:VWFA domain-containing protein n=1 Tax=Stieleria neptunia TaxID=2527979 RepID=A0A518HRT1_9BACT|nr:DUF58 domain-containing protein [Stieleria neptunia]QDV43560.1 hypothetical protein Enr13x_34170 [Stieleria neptunia]
MFSSSASQTTPYVSRFFEASSLAGLERMRFSPRRAVEGNFSGRHRSRRRGGAGEFVDYREYAPGDDVRRIDWKAMGRMGRAYLKIFQDETDLNCTLVLDVSGSMAQGAGNQTAGAKLEWMQYFATALSHLIVFNRDAVGLAVIGEQLTEYIAPSSSTQSRQLMHHTIEQLEAAGTTQLGQGLEDVLKRSPRGGVLVILSDFLVDSIDEVVSRIRTFRARGWEVITIHLIHPDEQNLPDGNAFRFAGLEGDGVVSCQLSEVRHAYQQRFEALAVMIRNVLSSSGSDYYRVSTNESYLEVLRSFLVVRGA